MTGVPVLAAIEGLQGGMVFGRFVGEVFGGDEKRARALLEALAGQDLLVQPVPGGGAASDATAERFDRLTAYFAQFERPAVSRYDYLERIRTAHVVFLVLGSMTSWIIGHLVACGVGRITGIDGDRVAVSNLARQAFLAEGDVETSKTEAARRQAVRCLSGLTDFRGVDAHITSAEQAESVLRAAGPGDLVVLTPTNHCG